MPGRSTTKEHGMAKSQLRSNREQKKPKQDKKTPAGTTSPFLSQAKAGNAKPAGKK